MKKKNLVAKVFLSNLNKNSLFREIRPFNSIRLKSILIKEHLKTSPSSKLLRKDVPVDKLSCWRFKHSRLIRAL